MEKSTGVFTCKTVGTYSFVVSGHTRNDSGLSVYLNDGIELYLRNTASGYYNNFSYTFTLTLNVGDRVKLSIHNGEVYVQPGSYPYRIYFTGFLLA